MSTQDGLSSQEDDYEDEEAAFLNAQQQSSSAISASSTVSQKAVNVAPVGEEALLASHEAAAASDVEWLPAQYRGKPVFVKCAASTGEPQAVGSRWSVRYSLSESARVYTAAGHEVSLQQKIAPPTLAPQPTLFVRPLYHADAAVNGFEPSAATQQILQAAAQQVDLGRPLTLLFCACVGQSFGAQIWPAILNRQDLLRACGFPVASVANDDGDDGSECARPQLPRSERFLDFSAAKASPRWLQAHAHVRTLALLATATASATQQSSCLLLTDSFFMAKLLREPLAKVQGAAEAMEVARARSTLAAYPRAIVIHSVVTCSTTRKPEIPSLAQLAAEVRAHAATALRDDTPDEALVVPAAPSWATWQRQPLVSFSLSLPSSSSSSSLSSSSSSSSSSLSSVARGDVGVHALPPTIKGAPLESRKRAQKAVTVTMQFAISVFAHSAAYVALRAQREHIAASRRMTMLSLS